MGPLFVPSSERNKRRPPARAQSVTSGAALASLSRRGTRHVLVAGLVGIRLHPMVPPQPRLPLRRRSRAPGSRPDRRGQPPNPSIPNTARRRAVIATIIGRWSDGRSTERSLSGRLLECRGCVCDHRQQTHHQPIMDRARRRRGKNSGHDRRDPMKRESKSSDPDAPYGLMEPLVLRRSQRVREGD